MKDYPRYTPATLCASLLPAYSTRGHPCSGCHATHGRRVWHIRIWFPPCNTPRGLSQMKVITTRLVPATSARPAQIYAEDDEGNSAKTPGILATGENPYDYAAQAFCRRFNLPDPLSRGELAPGSYVYVWAEIGALRRGKTWIKVAQNAGA